LYRHSTHALLTGLGITRASDATAITLRMAVLKSFFIEVTSWSD
jgi:hypothetical protein